MMTIRIQTHQGRKGVWTGVIKLHKRPDISNHQKEEEQVGLH